MKLYLLSILAFTVFMISACGTEKRSNAKQDSLEAAAAADSMLKEALEADTVNSDTLKADSVN